MTFAQPAGTLSSFSRGRAAPMPSTELVILRELLAREPGYLSGAALGTKLGISRVAVWQLMLAIGPMNHCSRSRW